MIALYHCAHDDANWCKQRDKKIDTTGVGQKQKTMVFISMVYLYIFYGLIEV